jgi:hypothetical protein
MPQERTGFSIAVHNAPRSARFLKLAPTVGIGVVALLGAPINCVNEEDAPRIVVQWRGNSCGDLWRCVRYRASNLI